jgi:predicted thioesterase
MGDEYITVGVRSVFEHLRATPVEVTLSAQARVVRRRSRKWYFKVAVVDEGGSVVATVSHLRVAVKAASHGEG